MNDEFQAEARYEHASTEMVWLWDEAPEFPEPPTDAPGWMLLSVVPQVHVERVALADGGRVRAHLLCIWRRRLTVPRMSRGGKSGWSHKAHHSASRSRVERAQLVAEQEQARERERARVIEANRLALGAWETEKLRATEQAPAAAAEVWEMVKADPDVLGVGRERKGYSPWILTLVLDDVENWNEARGRVRALAPSRVDKFKVTLRNNKSGVEFLACKWPLVNGQPDPHGIL